MAVPTAPTDNRLAPVVVLEWTAEQIELIKNTVAKGATDDELKLFAQTCARVGLDPFARQIHFVKRKQKQHGQYVEVGTTQTGIDGFRVIAERSGKYAGQVGPFWCDESGEWKDVWLKSTPPAAARVGVLRTDFKEPLWGTARFEAYAQRNDYGLLRMWQTMSDLMIAKCAEALALRRAFPQDLSGLYIAEEMAQADDHEPKNITPPPAGENRSNQATEQAAATAEPAPASQQQAPEAPKMISKKQGNLILDLCEKKGVNPDEFIPAFTGKGIRELTTVEASKVIVGMQQLNQLQCQMQIDQHKAKQADTGVIDMTALEDGNWVPPEHP